MALLTAEQLLEKVQGKKIEVIYLGEPDKDEVEHDYEIQKGVEEAKAIGCLQGHYKEGAL